jgi:hypothetical protein
MPSFPQDLGSCIAQAIKAGDYRTTSSAPGSRSQHVSLWVLEFVGGKEDATLLTLSQSIPTVEDSDERKQNAGSAL